MKVYMLFPKTREIIRSAQKEKQTITKFSKGLVLTSVNSLGEKSYKTYDFRGNLRKTVNISQLKNHNSTINKFSINDCRQNILKENTVTRFNDSNKVELSLWSADFGKKVEKAKRFSAKYLTYDDKGQGKTQTGYLSRYI